MSLSAHKESAPERSQESCRNLTIFQVSTYYHVGFCQWEGALLWHLTPVEPFARGQNIPIPLWMYWSFIAIVLNYLIGLRLRIYTAVLPRGRIWKNMLLILTSQFISTQATIRHHAARAQTWFEVLSFNLKGSLCISSMSLGMSEDRMYLSCWAVQ